MLAIVVERFGGPEVLELRDRPVPAPAAGEVLIRVHAIGVNFSDTERRRAVYDAPPLPYVPGSEAAGVVEALGEGVPDRWLGRRVAFWAMRSSGAYAQYVTAPAAALFDLRDGIPYEQAVSLPAQGLTAYALANVATQLGAGATALVHAAAGGVGTLLIQLLRHRGVTVFGAASSRAKLDVVADLGAHALESGDGLVDRLRQATAGRGVDVVFDSVGLATVSQSFAALAPYGHLVWFGESSGPPPPVEVDSLYGRSLKVSAFWMATDPPGRWGAAREELQQLVSGGTLKLLTAGVHPLARAAEVHRLLESRGTIGKLVMVP